jgi:alpha-N-acetylglucosaminidase
VLANYALPLQRKFVEAYKNKDLASFKTYSNQFIALIEDMDKLLATRKDFMLGPWINDARKWGTNEKEKNLYELNAKDLITLWGDKDCPLNEYACRQWSGLLDDFYKPRWQQFFTKLEDAIISKSEIDMNAFTTQIKNWEWKWVNQRKEYPLVTSGNPIEVSKELYKKYFDLIKAEYK